MYFAIVYDRDPTFIDQKVLKRFSPVEQKETAQQYVDTETTFRRGFGVVNDRQGTLVYTIDLTRGNKT